MTEEKAKKKKNLKLNQLFRDKTNRSMPSDIVQDSWHVLKPVKNRPGYVIVHTIHTFCMYACVRGGIPGQ